MTKSVAHNLDFETAQSLSQSVQLILSGHSTLEARAAIIAILADLAINVCDSPTVGREFVNEIARIAKDKLTADWLEGKAALHASREAGNYRDTR